MFDLDNSRPPTSEEGLAALTTQPANAKRWKGPYLRREVPKDPWGNPYQYRFPSPKNGNTFDVWSSGPDGKLDTQDDVTNWSLR
jgi:general secretion pathway protein G